MDKIHKKLQHDNFTDLILPSTHDVSCTVFAIFEHTLTDLHQRMGVHTPTSAADPAALARMWEERAYTFLRA